MEHKIDASAGLPAGRQVRNIPKEELVILPNIATDGFLDLLEVRSMPCREVVECDDGLPKPQQGLDQMRADESSAARNEPTVSVAG
jgi:hypothetical protein